MRSQAAKPLPKKGALGKTSFKATKQVKKRAVAQKKVKTSPKSALKGLKKVSADNAASNKNDGDGSGNEKNDTTSEAAKVGSSKPIVSRDNSPSKKSKKESKETKDKAKVSPKKVVSKRPVKLTNKNKSSPKLKADKKDSDVVKYKINVEAIKKGPTKTTKAKCISKKGYVSQKKRGATKESKEDEQGKGHKEENENIDKTEKNSNENLYDSNKVEETSCLTNETKNEKKEEKMSMENPSSKLIEPPMENIVTIMSNNQAETPKVEVERPPKFFTSTRSPRTVDIDVKCCKNSKGNLSVSERFLSMKCESKSDDTSKEKSSSSNLISQGPEIDVYTFTEKVDSPKSILSDFRSPVNKNVGRVRPIARVKGTIIDKKTDSDRKKYSPHRPIEEVVKQLKAIKRSEDIIIRQTNYEPSGVDFGIFSDEKEVEDKPPIVSKSYKMVARKSSITGQPFSPIKFPDQEEPTKEDNKTQGKFCNSKKNANKAKKSQKKSLSDDEINTSTFSLNTKTFHYTSSEESVSESNDDNDSKDSTESENFKNKRTKNKKYKRITDSAKKSTSKELKELSKDSLIDLKDTSALLGNEKPSKRRLKLLSMWSGPKKHRMASLNALAKVHCLYENESRTHMELGLMKTVDRQVIPSTSKVNLCPKKKESKSRDSEKQESTSESEYENKREKDKDSSDSSDDSIPQRTLRGVPGIRSAGKYWDPKSSTSSSEDSELEFKTKKSTPDKKKVTPKSSSNKSDSDKPPPKMKKTAGVPIKKKRNRNEVVMDLKDMVVQKRMASLNATAILAASYEKRSPKSSKDDTTSDSCSDESFSQKSKNLLSSGVKSELKNEEPEKESDEALMADKKQKVEVIVNQDTDVTITGVYSTHHHEGFCTVSGMQYRISSTSHTQTTATANCEKVSFITTKYRP